MYVGLSFDNICEKPTPLLKKEDSVLRKARHLEKDWH